MKYIAISQSINGPVSEEMSDSVQCVLFDMDGLLLDTENLYTEGTQSILSEFGHIYDWEFKSKLMGKRTDEVARMIVDHYQLPMTPEQWVERSTAIYQELFPHVKSLKGIYYEGIHLPSLSPQLGVARSQ